MKKSTRTIIDYEQDYLDWIDVEKGLSPATQESYARFLARFFAWLDGQDLQGMKPHELTPEHIWDYRIFLARKARSEGSKRGLSKSTQNSYLIALRSLLTYFAEHDITSLPPEKIQLPKRKKDKEVRFLTLKQLRRLFEGPNTKTLKGVRDRAILETLFSTGMRVSELVALNREQVESILKQDGVELGIIGKGGKARTVYLSERAVLWLRRYLKKRTDTAEALFINVRSYEGAPRRLTTRSVERLVKAYATRAGLPSNTTPHVLRHTFATDLLAQGVDIRILQEFLGHSSITATQIYTHVTSKQLKDIHRKFHSGNAEDDK